MEKQNFMRISLQFFAEKGNAEEDPKNGEKSGTDKAGQEGVYPDPSLPQTGSDVPPAPSVSARSASRKSDSTPITTARRGEAVESSGTTEWLSGGGASFSRPTSEGERKKRGERRDTSGGSQDPHKAFVTQRKDAEIRSVISTVSKREPVTSIPDQDALAKEHGVIMPIALGDVGEAQRTRVNGLIGSDDTFHMAGNDVTRDIAVPVVGIVNAEDVKAAGAVWPSSATSNRHPGISITNEKGATSSGYPEGYTKNYMPRFMSLAVSMDANGNVTLGPGNTEGGKTSYFKRMEVFEVKPSQQAKDQQDDVKKAVYDAGVVMSDMITDKLGKFEHSGSPLSADCIDSGSAVTAANVVATIMQEAGATLFEATRIYARSYGHALNNLMRDGNRYKTIPEEMLCGAFSGAASSSQFSEGSSHYSNWSASKFGEAGMLPFWILTQETDKKFSTKDTLFWQSRGPARPLFDKVWQFVDAANQPDKGHLFVQGQYVKERRVASTYSYMEGTDNTFGVSTLMYDDGHLLIYPTNPDHWLDGKHNIRIDYKRTRSGDSQIAMAQSILWPAILDFLDSRKYQIAKGLGVQKSGSKTLDIPMTMTVSSMSPWAFIVMMSAEYMNVRAKAKLMTPFFKDYLRDVGNPFKGFSQDGDAGTAKVSEWIDIATAVEGEFENFSQPNLTGPVIPGHVSGGVRLGWVAPDLFKFVDSASAGVAQHKTQVVRWPWYVSAWSFFTGTDAKSSLSNKFSYRGDQVYVNMPKFSTFSRNDQLDAWQNMTMEDVLTYNRMLDLSLGSCNEYGEPDNRLLYVTAYTSSMDNAGAVDVVTTCDDAMTDLYSLQWFLSRPRSKPYRFFTLPGGVATPWRKRSGGTVTKYSDKLATADQEKAANFIVDNFSYVVRFWHAAKSRVSTPRAAWIIEGDDMALTHMLWDATQASRFADDASTTYSIPVFPEAYEYVPRGSILSPHEKAYARREQIAQGKASSTAVDWVGSYEYQDVVSDLTFGRSKAKDMSAYDYVRTFCLPFAISPFDMYRIEPAYGDSDKQAVVDSRFDHVAHDAWLRENGFSGFLPYNLTELVTKFANKKKQLSEAYLRGSISLKDVYVTTHLKGTLGDK